MKRWTWLALLALLVLGWSGATLAQDRGNDDLLDELQKILDEEKRKSNHDRALVRRLESLIRKYRGRDGSGGGSDRSGGESGGSRRGPGSGGGGGGYWSPESIVARMLGDIDLDGEERAKVTRILIEFWVSRTLVRTNDHMSCYPDIERDRNNRLARAVGQRKAKEIIESVDALINRWSRWGGRGRGGR
jgi:hypothetical protein